MLSKHSCGADLTVASQVALIASASCRGQTSPPASRHGRLATAADPLVAPLPLAYLGPLPGRLRPEVELVLVQPHARVLVAVELEFSEVLGAR